jgi:hypothetical protein
VGGSGNRPGEVKLHVVLENLQHGDKLLVSETLHKAISSLVGRCSNAYKQQSSFAPCTVGFGGAGSGSGGSRGNGGFWTLDRILLTALGLALAVPAWRYINRRYLLKVLKRVAATRKGPTRMFLLW